MDYTSHQQLETLVTQKTFVTENALLLCKISFRNVTSVHKPP